MLGMLENGELKTSVGPVGELLIDITDFNPDMLAKRMARPSFLLEPEDQRLREEAIASTIVSHFQSILDDALALAVQWYANENQALE